MLDKYLSKIFLLAIALALFLDAINVDAIFTSHAMIREEYEGENSEIDSALHQELIVFHTHSGTKENQEYQPSYNVSRPMYLVDEDSYSLAARPTIIDEGFLSHSIHTITRPAAPRVLLLNFYSLRKLQI